MNHAHPLKGGLFAFFLLIPYAARAEPVVSIERTGDVFEVRIETTVAVDAATAWQVLTDYERVAEFVPDMLASRLIPGPGGKKLLEQRGESTFLLFKTRVNVTLQIEEMPPARLRFHAVGGNMKKMQGEWQVSRADSGINLAYHAQLEPGFRVPPLIGTALMRRNVSRQVNGVVQEMLKRYAAGHAAAPPQVHQPHPAQ